MRWTWLLRLLWRGRVAGAIGFERQLNLTSRNSSVALSSDLSLTRQQRRQLRRACEKQLERERCEARKQGGQPGHEGSSWLR